MGSRHKIEQYYSIRVSTKDGTTIVIDTTNWNGSVENLVDLVNKSTDKNWEKVRAYKYIQHIDMCKNSGSRVVGKKLSLLKVARIGSSSLCTKVDENFTRDGVIPQNILAFFGEQKVKA